MASRKERTTHKDYEKPQKSSSTDNVRFSDEVEEDDKIYTSRQPRGGGTPPTHGTYIFTAEQGEYGSLDVKHCECKCCPHHELQSKLHSQQIRADIPARDPRVTHTRSRTPPGEGRDKHRQSDRVVRDGVFILEGIDKTSRGSLGHRQGRPFQLEVWTEATASDIMDLVAPERDRCKVMVRWQSGEREQLDECITVRELRRYAQRLEIKDRKRVHWL